MVAAGLLVLSLLPLSLGRPAPAREQFSPSQRDLVGDLLEQAIQLPITIAMNPSNQTGLIDTLLDISNPASPNYRKWLTKDEVRIALLIYVISQHTNALE